MDLLYGFVEINTDTDAFLYWYGFVEINKHNHTQGDYFIKNNCLVTKHLSSNNVKTKDWINTILNLILLTTKQHKWNNLIAT